jgi:hypothetical protein
MISKLHVPSFTYSFPLYCIITITIIIVIIDSVLRIREGTFGRATFWRKQTAAQQMPEISDKLQQYMGTKCCTLFIAGECLWRLFVGSLHAAQRKDGEHTAISWLVWGGNEPSTAVASFRPIPHGPSWSPGGWCRFWPSANDTDPKHIRGKEPLCLPCTTASIQPRQHSSATTVFLNYLSLHMMVYQSTRGNIPEYLNLQQGCCQDPKWRADINSLVLADKARDTVESKVVRR